MLTRFRNMWLWILIAVIIAFNSIALPLFLYGAFGSDTNVFGFDRISWLMNVFLVMWVVLIAPNMPLVGLVVSVIQADEHEFYHHLLTFGGVLIGALCFFLGDRDIYKVFALLFTQGFGITSLAFLIHKKWIHDHTSTPDI